VIASSHEAHPAHADGIDRQMRMLHGEYDGGGLLAIAFRGARIISAGREGGARVWRLCLERDELVPEGELSTGSLASSLYLQKDADVVWLASLDGSVSSWVLPPVSAGVNADSAGSEQPTQPMAGTVLKACAPVFSISVDEGLGLVACGTADGGVELFTLTGQLRGRWLPAALDGSSCRAVRILAVNGTNVLVAGGTNGQLVFRKFDPDLADCFEGSEEAQELEPAHNGQVVALEALPGGCLVSGAHDGTLRIWSLTDEPKVLYGLGGYKVWLGSVCTDGRRLVSDGVDNSVVVHDFGVEADAAE